jgi:hypothetical protein
MWGPLVAAKLRRTAIGYAAIFALGCAVAWTASSEALRAFGVGLVFPGAGFLYDGGWLGPLLFVLTLLAFAVALFAWFGAGMIIAPAAVWLGAALIPLATAGNDNWDVVRWIVPAMVAVLALVQVGRLRRSYVTLRGLAEERNAYLVDATPGVRDQPIVAAAELSDEELASSRYLYDLALRPFDDFDGYQFIDQFQSSSVRYQINYAQYALSLLQFTRLPAFSGYLGEAQRLLIEKTQHKRVWGYWFLENLWGNLRINPDPIVRDNIMFSGNTSLMVGMYETTDGDQRFSQPGSFRYEWNRKRAFEYDYHSMHRTISTNLKRTEIGLMVCEPNWLYNMCNGIAQTSLAMHDRLHGTTDLNDLLPRYLQSMEEEFMTVDGEVVGIRSSRMGMTLPGITTIVSDCAWIWYQNALAPAMADRLWEIVRHDFAKVRDDGTLDLKLRGADKIDVGNYRSGKDFTAVSMLLQLATELGDNEMRVAALQHLVEGYGPTTKDGVRQFDVSVLSNINLMLALFTRHNGWRDLVLYGPPDEWKSGPRLGGVTYPEVLVARAVSDGQDLDLVLAPGMGHRRVTLPIERLVPGRAYRMSGGVTTVDGATDVIADDQGQASLQLDLGGRTRVRLTPNLG